MFAKKYHTKVDEHRTTKSGLVFMVLVTFLFLSAPYVFLDSEKQVLDEESRRQIPGSFIELDDGYVRYEFVGQPGAPVIVLVPGISIPMEIWDRTTPALVNAGYRVLRFDLFGRGFSDRPEVEYDPEYFNGQINELLEKLDIQKPFHLVGLAYGGLIGVLYTDAHPEMVGSLTMIAPDGLGTEIPFFARVMKTPIVGRLFGLYFLKIFGNLMFEERLDRYTQSGHGIEEVRVRFRQQLRFEGFKSALVNSIVNMPLETAHLSFRSVAERGTATLIIWGTEDQITDPKLSNEMKTLMPDAELVFVDAGHLPQYENPDMTNAALLNFLASQ